MAEKKINNDENEFIGLAIAIVFIVIGGVLFFGWEQFGYEILLKILSLIFVLMGFSFLGIEITEKTNESGAADLGIGLGIILSGLIFGDIDFVISLNLLVLLIVGFGSIMVLSSIFKLFSQNQGFKNPNLSFFHKTLIVAGQFIGTGLAIIEFFQFFMK